MSDDVLTRDNDGNLAVRTVSSTGDNYVNPDDVYTRDSEGKLCVRTTGEGGGGSVDYSRVVEKIAVIPSAETATVGKVYMYMGESNATYTHGYIYECVATQTASDVAFSGSIISSWPVADFVAYLQEGGSAYNEVTHGTLTYDATGNLWDLVGYDANGIKVLSFHEYTEDLEDFGCVFASSTHQDGDNCTFTMTTEESGKKWKRLDVQPAGGSGAVASVNGKTGVVVLDATDVNALPDSTKYVASASWTIDSSTYVMTLQLKDQDGSNIGTAQTIDLPLESVVVNGSYDSTNKQIVLTLQNGNTINVPVADLVSGLQSEITAQDPLSADLVDDTNTTHKFVSAAEKTTWNGKQDAISDLATIRSGAAAGATAVQPGDLATVATTGAYSDLSGTPTIPTVGNGTITITQGGVTKGTFTTNQSGDTTIDVDAGGGQTIQYTTMPTASADNVGDIVQFVGTEDSTYTTGYFYKCVFNRRVYSWARVDVQPQSGGLPSQTGHAGEFLTTDGTDVSWATPSGAPTVPATMPTLAVNDWINNAQTVNVTGVTASNIVFVSPAPASAADYAAAGITCTAQGSGTLTFTCTSVPSNAITVNVVIFG